MDSIQKVKVSNMRNPRSNKEVPNQFIIVTNEGTYFQSYRTVIAFKPRTYNTINQYPVYLDESYWDYSTTTGKYRNEFLEEGIADTRRKIEDGTYKLVDLNA